MSTCVRRRERKNLLKNKAERERESEKKEKGHIRDREQSHPPLSVCFCLAC